MARHETISHDVRLFDKSAVDILLHLRVVSVESRRIIGASQFGYATTPDTLRKSIVTSHHSYRGLGWSGLFACWRCWRTLQFGRQMRSQVPISPSASQDYPVLLR